MRCAGVGYPDVPLSAEAHVRIPGLTDSTLLRADDIIAAVHAVAPCGCYLSAICAAVDAVIAARDEPEAVAVPAAGKNRLPTLCQWFQAEGHECGSIEEHLKYIGMQQQLSFLKHCTCAKACALPAMLFLLLTSCN